MSEFKYLSSKPLNKPVAIGDSIEFPLHTFAAYGEFSNISAQQRTQIHRVTIVDSAGRGLYGKVHFGVDFQTGKPLDYVLKTALPGPLALTARMANWGLREFPFQTQLTAAQLNYQMMKLIHGVIEPVTDGNFYVPKPLGYTHLPQTYTQIIEKVIGRGPILSKPDDLDWFTASQKYLTEIGFEFGLEQAAQIHPNNPRGKPNLWRELASDRGIWLDTLPAIQHTMENIFGFQKETREYFYPKAYHRFNRPYTFNRIHIDQYMQALQRHKHKFPEQDYWQLMKEVMLYEQLLEQFKNEPPTPVVPPTAAKALVQGSAALTKDAGIGVAKGIRSGTRVVFSSAEQNKLILRGTRKAVDKGYIAQSELCQLENLLNDPLRARRFVPLRTLYALHEATGLGITVLKSALAGTYLVHDHSFTGVMQALGMWAGCTLLGGTIKNIETRVVAKLTNHSPFKAAERAGFIPSLGDHIAVPAQIAADAGEDILHYTIRDLMAKLAFLGGENSDLEAWLMRKVGSPLQRWLLKP